MAAKWKAQQRKQRWEHSAVLVPASVIARAVQEPRISGFSTVLREWSTLGNTYDQVSGIKRLVGALESASDVEAGAFSVVLSVFVEILFLEGSKPVHRTMLSALAQLKGFEGVLEAEFYRCCGEYGVRGCKERRFGLVAVGLSLASMSNPGILRNVIQKCSGLIASGACFDVKDALSRARSGENSTPALMEECQDAMSTVYYMLQNRLSGNEEVAYDSVYSEVVLISLDVLQTMLMSRDCVVAAGVCLCAAAQMGLGSQCDLALLMANALFPQGDSRLWIAQKQESKGIQECTGGKMEDVIRDLRCSTLVAEASKFTEFGMLCVLRGLLTSASRELLNFCLVKEVPGKQEVEVWSLLHSGILPALCDATERSFDSHFKFHGMTALQICLQQIKASVIGSVTSASLKELQNAAERNGLTCGAFAPFPSAMTSRIMQIIWNNWEDPLNQTVRQVQMIFDLLADLQSLPFVQDQSRTTQDGTKSFLHQIAKDLLTVGGHRKGRYVPLATLALRIGAQTLLEMSPELLFQTVFAMSDDGVCCAASSFLRIFLERLRDECWSIRGVSQGSIRFRQLWVPPMFAGLIAGNPKLRINIHTYAVSIGLEIDNDSLLQMLGFVLDGSTDRDVPAWEDLRGAAGLPGTLTPNQRVAAFVSLIKVARALALMESEFKTSEDDDAEEIAILVKGTIVYAPVSLLELALTHIEEGLRVDAAELICLNPKTAVMPSPLEMHLMKLAMPLNMRCSSTAFRMKWTSLLKKFFSRVRVATDRQMKLELSKSDHRQNGITRTGLATEEMVSKLGSSVVSLSELQSFMQWLSRLLVSSLYPSAPYERKYMAMEILNVLLDVWRPAEELKNKFSPYGKELFSADYAMILLGAVVDSWDRLRENSFKILIRYPTPLPGLDTQGSVAEVVSWGKSLACSPRVRESDAGALVLRLIFRKYVCDQGWRVTLHPAPEILKASQAGDEIVRYIESLNDWLEAGVLEGEKNLVKACKQSFVHGVLLTLRYTVSELDWISDSVRTNIGGLRRAFERLFKLLLKVTTLALWVVSADALNLQDQEEDNEDEIAGDNGDGDGESSEEGDDGGFLAPREQMVMVGCWLSMKEVSLLLGTVARGAPLPGCSYNARRKTDDSQTLGGEDFVMLESGQLEEIGQHFLQVLLAMKHNGAIDKTRVGFIALCNRLLLSSDTRLSKMPEIWMQQLMLHTIAEGQSLDDLLRRSAGIPAAFLALFLSEPDGAPKKLLPVGLSWLIDNISKFMARQDDDLNVVPIVHAFNTLRVTFNDTNLSTDTSGFCAEATIVAIKAFASPYWQVRNSATLAFTALLHRTVGFLNVHKQATARRAITGFEFFNRYPALHPFLLKELQLVTTQMENGDKNNVTESRLHPSLAPILIILSRLRPSILNTRMDDWLSPSAFMPFVMKCATDSNLKIRVLASRALAPLVTTENLLSVMLELIQHLSAGKVPFNTVHGVLLQLSSLLKSNCMDLPNPEQQGQIVVEIFKRIKGCRFKFCFIVIAAHLTVLKDLLELAYQCQQVQDTKQQLQAVLLRLCGEAIISTRKQLWDSTQVDLRATAAQIYFTTILKGWTSFNLGNNGSSAQYATFDQSRCIMQATEGLKDFFTALGEALADKMYEVRLATLKVLTSFSASGISFPADFVQDGRTLHGLLAERLYTEQHPRCIKRILQVFLCWDLLTVGDDQQDCMKIWNSLLRIYNSTKVSKTREFAIRCLGSCLQHITSSMKKRTISELDSEGYCEMFETWDRLNRIHSAPSEPVNMRRAVSSAIIASKCLGDAKWLKDVTGQLDLGWYSTIVLSAWSVCINLLEDEDVLLRQQLAQAVQDVISAHKKAAVPAQVEKVLGFSLAYLKLQFDDCDFYFDFLAGWILGEARFGFATFQNGDLVRKLFDKELDNHHEEQLLVVQLCCSDLRSYVQRFDSDNEFITKWRSRFLNQSVACTKWCLELQQTTRWVGGITNHQDVFKRFYRTLLGLLILAGKQISSTSREETRVGLLELTTLKTISLSPMISNLLLRLLTDYEQVLGISLDADSFRAAAVENSFCSDFQPFFLLE